MTDKNSATFYSDFEKLKDLTFNFDFYLNHNHNYTDNYY